VRPRSAADLPDYRCPVCGTESGMAVSPRQAFCTNDDACSVLMFNPSLLDGGLSDAQTVNLSELDRGVDPS
jgi:hypothetical protein